MIGHVNFWSQNISPISDKRVKKQSLETNQSFCLNAVKNSSEIEETIERISEQLEDGNFEAISELEKAGISYTTEEKENGYKVKFDVGDSKYTITYVNSAQKEFKPQKYSTNDSQGISSNNYSDDIQDLLAKSISELQTKAEEMSAPKVPMLQDFQTEEEYKKALENYYIAEEKYENINNSYWDLITDLTLASSISKEQERLEHFDNHIKNLIDNVKKTENGITEKKEIENILNYAKDFKSKMNEKIKCEKELNDCIDAKLNLQTPKVPQADKMNAIEYQKEFEIYKKLFAQYTKEQELLEKREEMLTRKLDLFNALLDGMFLYDDV